jgi:hypothetical protein
MTTYAYEGLHKKKCVKFMTDNDELEGKAKKIKGEKLLNTIFSFVVF